MEDARYLGIIESILFAVGNSISIDKLTDVLELDRKKVKELLGQLKDNYQAQDRGIELVWLEDRVQLSTKASTYDYLAKIARTPAKYTLTDAVLETLSIVAYKQPVTRGEIEKIRGVSCDHAINKLLEYELIEEVGRLDAPGKPLLFGTTEQFLRSFGVKSISDLPEMSPEMYEDFKQQASDEVSLAAKEEEDEQELMNIEI